ncbi:MAG: hypothetical protein M3P53_02370 [Actinomycetota bacterium]|nr:hypothetical protein [Actinomycetota bacterium]
MSSSDEPYPVVTLVADDGGRWLIRCQKMLRVQVEHADPRPGDYFGVRYHGEKAVTVPLKTGGSVPLPYDDWSIAHERPQPFDQDEGAS